MSLTFSDVISQSHMFLSKFHVFCEAITLISKIAEFDDYIGRMGMRGPDTTVIHLENRLKPNKYALS